MSVFKRYNGKKSLPDDSNWSKGTWYTWTRVGGHVLHKALRGIGSEKEAQEIEQSLVRQIASKVEGKAASQLARRVNKTAKIKQPEYIYILESGRFFKIGRTTELEKRWKALADTIIPFETRIVFTIQVADAQSVERFIHERYAPYRTRGEWFLLPAKRLQNLMYDLTDKCCYLAAMYEELQPTFEMESQANL